MSVWDNYECPYCDPDDYDNYEFFSSAKLLAKHRDEVHPGKPIYVCSACEKTFQDWWKGTEHVQDKHDEYCEECQREYLYEALYLSPKDTKRIGEIHTQIGKLKKELEELCATPKIHDSEGKTA